MIDEYNRSHQSIISDRRRDGKLYVVAGRRPIGQSDAEGGNNIGRTTRSHDKFQFGFVLGFLSNFPTLAQHLQSSLSTWSVVIPSSSSKSTAESDFSF